jgi:tetratricopeptide (TPR) repeat protein
MASLKNRPIRREGAAGSEREVVVKERPDLPDDQLFGVSKEGRRFARAADLLFARGRMGAAQRELEKAIASSASPLLSAKLAVVALAARDLQTAEKAARAALEGSSDLPGPNVTLAEILVQSGKAGEAEEPLGRAVSINPFDPRIHRLLQISARARKDAPAEARATAALRLLESRGKAEPRSLGGGGLITVDATPFSRVFLTREGAARLPAGAVTPTAPFELKPGSYQLELIPPSGAPIVRSIVVAPSALPATPQRIAPNVEGS